MELEELAIRPYPKSILPFPSLLPSTTIIIITADPALSGPGGFYDSQNLSPASESIGHPLALKSTSRRRRLQQPSTSSALLSSHSHPTYVSSLHRQVAIPACVWAKRTSSSSSWLGMPRCNTTETTAAMSELICNGCRSLVTYNRSANNIRCSRCNTLNSTRSASQLQVHLTCGGCRMTLMYPPGAATVGCANCRHTNHVRGQGSSAPPDAWPQTVLVENPRTMNDKGKLVTNVAVGVTSWKR